MDLRVLLAACCASFCYASSSLATDVPAELQAWQGWALDGLGELRCPFFANAAPADNGSDRICAWPEWLELDLTATGGHFAQRWQVYSESWIALPGDFEHWPSAVRIDGNRGAVVARDGIPQARLGPGNHQVTGEFTWRSRPQALPIPRRTGLVSLRLDGAMVAAVDRPDAAVWLGTRSAAPAAKQMEIRVYRLLSDQVPAELTTRLRLLVAGEAREETLTGALPQGFTPIAVQSVLPVRIEHGGSLRIQVRAGSWTLDVMQRAPDIAARIAVPPSAGSWPKQEIWCFAADDRLRVAAVEGIEAIDPAQADVPDEWREYPCFRATPGGQVQVIERSRGLSSANGNHLQLQRDLYLDFAHGGYTVVDAISGTMQTSWRLDMTRPYRLMSAETAGQQLLITQGRDRDASGIELREPDVGLQTLGRLDKAGGKVSATGWTERFDAVRGVLHLPPGHRLLAAFGADSTPGAWIERWGLLDLFLVLISAVIAWRMSGWRFAVPVFVATALVHQESTGIVWWLLALLLAIALANATPAGWANRIAIALRNALLIILLVVLVPFSITQIRYAFYPQLSVPWQGYLPAQPQAVDQMRAAPAAAGAPEGKDETNMAPPPPPLKARAELQEAVVTSARRAASAGFAASSREAGATSVDRYAPGTVVQAGPGRPQWDFMSYEFSWNGPVDPSESVRFWIAPPSAMGLWRLTCVALLIWIFVQLALRSVDLRGQWRRWSIHGASSVLLGSLLWSMLGVQPVHAANTPDGQILNELRTRLAKAPKCVPTCGELLTAKIVLSAQRLEATLDFSALAPVAVALPWAGEQFGPDVLTIDGKAGAGVYRTDSKQNWLALSPGVHTVRLAGRLPSADTVQLAFPLSPRSIAVGGDGWDVSGMSDGRLPAGTLELVRRRSAPTAAGGKASPADIPPFVRVHRHIRLDLDWTVRTEVSRVAPAKGGFTLGIPTIAGESVLTSNLKLQNGSTVVAGFESDTSQIAWQSNIEHASQLSLSAKKNVPWTEQWSFEVSPMWRAEFSGVPPVAPDDEDTGHWVFTYFPRSGETLNVAVSRPQALPGDTLAIDRVSERVNVGKRVLQSHLNFDYRSTRGGRHTLSLGKTARVDSVKVDNTTIALRPDNGELPLALLPGTHAVQVDWTQDQPVGVLTRSATIDLHAAASNVRTGISLPADRWVLFAGGPGVGPAILYWGEVVVFLALAVMLARSGRSPLNMREWLLLGLGLSTFSWTVLLLFAGWLFVVRWRDSFDASGLSRRKFNTMQVVLIVFSAIAVCSLVAAIPYGLLATPDMRIAGNADADGALHWFNDQTAGALPRTWALSVSLWWYKLAMLLWALWLAFALVRWLPLAWHALSRQGWWRTALANP
jgi:hypothetical protein